MAWFSIVPAWYGRVVRLWQNDSLSLHLKASITQNSSQQSSQGHQIIHLKNIWNEEKSWRDKLLSSSFFLCLSSDDISDTGFSTFEHAENCRSHSRAALGKCSMCVHEWKPLLTMVRHETSFMFCVFVSLSVSQLSAALLGWLRKDLLFSWGNRLYSAHLVGRYSGVERRDKSHWIT